MRMDHLLQPKLKCNHSCLRADRLSNANAFRLGSEQTLHFRQPLRRMDGIAYFVVVRCEVRPISAFRNLDKQPICACESPSNLFLFLEQRRLFGAYRTSNMIYPFYHSLA